MTGEMIARLKSQLVLRRQKLKIWISALWPRILNGCKAPMYCKRLSQFYVMEESSTPQGNDRIQLRRLHRRRDTEDDPNNTGQSQ